MAQEHYDVFKEEVIGCVDNLTIMCEGRSELSLFSRTSCFIALLFFLVMQVLFKVNRYASS